MEVEEYESMDKREMIRMDEPVIRVRNKKEMLLFEQNDISEDMLYSIFMKEPSKTVYIVENDILIGIITLYDFQKNQLSNMELINKSFKKIDVDNESMAPLTLKENRKFRSLPIVDAKGKIVKEYYREDAVKEQIPFPYIKQVCQEAVIWGDGFDKIILLAPVLSEKENRQLQEVIAKAENHIAMKNDISVSELCELASNHKTCIVDFDFERYKAGKVLYEKNGIKSFGIDCSVAKLEEMIYFKSRQFESIAVAGLGGLFEGLVSDECELYYFEPDKCISKEDGIYKYEGELDCGVESVFTLVDFSMESRMAAGNKMAPIVSFFTGCNEALYGCYDIIYNIIPKLEEKNVNYLIIDRHADIMPEIQDQIKGRGNACERNIDTIMDTLVKDKEIAKELRAATVLEIKNGIIQRINYTGKYVNRINGERYTWNNPKEYQHTIYLYGPCIVAGDFVEDKETIASHLQKYVGQDYCVKNYGGTWETIAPMIRRNQYKAKDVVILFAYAADVYRNCGLYVHNLIEAYRRVPDLTEHVWNNFNHCDKVVIQSLAKELASICQKQHFLTDENDKNSNEVLRFGCGQSQNQKETPWQVKEWIASVEKYKVNTVRKSVGSIVMNCNPFTYGHRYLIEKALEQVDILYVFVVEEDRSFFKFKDRIAMVKAGTADLENVIVIPSGKYIISTATLPGYFEKESKPNVEFDAADDLEIFAGAIAKAFDITIRFAGEEPADEFTRRYNQFMSQILPSYGIRFCEIPRKCLDGKIISASLVRKHMQEKEYEKVKDLVMPPVYEYLKEFYFKKDGMEIKA